MPEEKTNQALNLAYGLYFELPIWQIRFAGETGVIALECRNPDTLQVSYAVFAAATGALILNKYQPPNSWWTGLADIQDKVLFLHQMDPTGMGQAKGIMAIDLPEEKIKWQLPGFSFYGLSRKKLYAREEKTDRAVLVGLNIEAGTLTGEGGNLTEVAPELAEFQAWRSGLVQVPAHYPAENSYFALLSQFLWLKTGITAVAAIDYLETTDRIIMGFYPESGTGARTYRVAVFNRQGGLLGQEECGKELTGLGTDNFFVLGELLFLLKDKKSLLAFRF